MFQSRVMVNNQNGHVTKLGKHVFEKNRVKSKGS